MILSIVGAKSGSQGELVGQRAAVNKEKNCRLDRERGNVTVAEHRTRNQSLQTAQPSGEYGFVYSAQTPRQKTFTSQELSSVDEKSNSGSEADVGGADSPISSDSSQRGSGMKVRESQDFQDTSWLRVSTT
jgi:hypothetical protein